MSEQEMFENVRILMCSTATPCVDGFTEASCLDELSDGSRYEAPIDAETREALSTCVQSWEFLACDEVLETQLMTEHCEGLEDYLDLQ